MTKTVAGTYVEFLERIDDLGDDLDRLIASSELAYDRVFHQYITSTYKKLMNDVIDSDLSDMNKFIMVENIKQLFEERLESVI